MRVRAALPALALATALACAPVTDNRLHDEASADFRSALVLPLNVMTTMPREFEGREGRVEEALESYLRERGRRVETMGFTEARAAWRASVDACRSARGECAFEEAARFLALRLRERGDHDLLILPYLRFALAENGRERVAWDGVERPVEHVGVWSGPYGPVAIRDVAMRAVSLEILALTRDGEQAFDGDGGLEVVDRLRATGDDDLVAAEPRDDLFGNRAWLREGVAMALHPLIPLPR